MKNLLSEKIDFKFQISDKSPFISRHSAMYLFTYHNHASETLERARTCPRDRAVRKV